MRKKWVITLVVIAVAAIGLLVGQYVTTRRSPTNTGTSSVAGGGQTTGISSAASAGSTAATASGDDSSAMKKPPAGSVAATGAALAVLPSAPPRTVGRIALSLVPPGEKYLVHLQPFGFGPTSPEGAKLVFRITSAAGSTKASNAEKLVGLTMVANLTPALAASYAKGGTYIAVLSFKTQGSALVPQISGPVPAGAAAKMSQQSAAQSK